jgi:hypothetical protein
VVYAAAAVAAAAAAVSACVRGESFVVCGLPEGCVFLVGAPGGLVFYG